MCGRLVKEQVVNEGSDLQGIMREADHDMVVSGGIDAWLPDGLSVNVDLIVASDHVEAALPVAPRCNEDSNWIP